MIGSVNAANITSVCKDRINAFCSLGGVAPRLVEANITGTLAEGCCRSILQDQCTNDAECAGLVYSPTGLDPFPVLSCCDVCHLGFNLSCGAAGNVGTACAAGTTCSKTRACFPYSFSNQNPAGVATTSPPTTTPAVSEGARRGGALGIITVFTVVFVLMLF
jgi:hypothetical protein